MAAALIGYTGFVGAVLAHQHQFTHKFNSSNIHSSHGGDYELVVCAAAPGSMFSANREPDLDARRVDQLIESLTNIKAEKFVLISSIAVLDRFDAGYDEAHFETQIELAYGRNRARLEHAVKEHFDHSLIIRLPALFGPGLKKNFLFDMLNLLPSMLTKDLFGQFKGVLPAELSQQLNAIYALDQATSLYCIDRALLEQSGNRKALEEAALESGYSALQFTNPKSRFQFYNISQLWSDIEKCFKNDLTLLHIAPEPLEAGEIFKSVNGYDMPSNTARFHSEDMHSMYAHLWGRNGPYTHDTRAILEDLSNFFADQRK